MVLEAFFNFYLKIVFGCKLDTSYAFGSVENVLKLSKRLSESHTLPIQSAFNDNYTEYRQNLRPP